jgi:hypothetical protein
VATDYTCAALPKRAKLGPAAAAARARHHHHRGHRSGPYNHTLPPLPRQGLEPMDGDGDGVGAGGGGGGRKRQRKSSNPTAPPPGESLQLASGQRVKAGSRVKFLLPGRREPSFGKLKLDTGGEPTHAGSPQPRSPPPSLTPCLPACLPPRTVPRPTVLRAGRRRRASTSTTPGCAPPPSTLQEEAQALLERLAVGEAILEHACWDERKVG